MTLQKDKSLEMRKLGCNGPVVLALGFGRMGMR